jgi:uncharacterized protein (UPF0332 family)
MDGREFFKVAERLKERSSEAEFRSAVSRAYYGAFILACQLQRSWGFNVPVGPQAHGVVRNRLQACDQPEISDVSQAGSKLGDLHSRRLDADYLRKENVGEKKTATRWVEVARDIITQLEGCESDPKKTKVILAIKTYEDKIKPPSR